MAALGAIGIQLAGANKRELDLPRTTPLGTAEGKNTRMRRIFDIAEAQNATKGFVRAFVQDFWRVTNGRTATYLGDFSQIRGTVKNSAGTGIARRVIIINGASQCVGRLTSAADGTFKILLDNQGFAVVLCIALPDDADVRNAVVAWKVTPVVAT